MSRYFKAAIFALGAALFSLPAFGQSSTIIGGGTSSVSCGPGITGCPSGPLSPTQALGNSGAAITGTTYTVDLTNNITTSDLARELVFTGSGASAWTLGAGSNGMGFDVVNRGTANITITATGNINGNSTLVIQPGLSANIFFGNSTWNAFNIPITTSSQFGTMKPDNSTITCTAGVCSSSSASASNWQAGNWYNSVAGASGNGVNITASVIEFVPVYFDRAVTIGALGGRMTAVNAGNMQFAVYASDATTKLPTGAPICSTSSISTASAGSYNGTCTAAISAAGWVWLGYAVDNATAAITSLGAGSPLSTTIGAGSQTALSGSGSFFGTEYKITGQTFGTWPTMNGTACGTGNCTTRSGTSGNIVPIIQFSLTSVP